MEEDDEFGDLYSDLPPRDAHNSLPIAEFSEEDELPAAPARFAKLVDSPSNGFLVGGGDSDEDEQELLLPGDEVSRKRNLPEDASSMPAHGTVGNFQKRFDESVATEGANRAVGKGASLLESSSAIAKGFEETLHTCTFTSSQILERSPAGEDLTNHAAATIPGLGTASNAVHFAPQDELYDEWGGGDAVGKVLKGDAAANLSGQDLDSESEDDLRIVLNDGHQFHQSFERGADGGMEERSEDEDGEDFVILAGGEAVADQEWGEEALLPIEGVQALAAEKVVPVGEEKQGDEKGQSGKMLQGVTRSVYGGRAYHSNHSQYRYVRPGALGGAGATSGAQGPNRVSLSKAGSGRGDWSGASRGFPPLPSWGNNASRGIQYGFEYTLPPNKTVYDIDLDTLDEKPWRHPSVDVSDYFNFGFNESSWKDYCQQLAQLRLESTMQSKIRVYESGRSEKEYDPDLPPELVAAAGIRGTSGEGAQHRQLGMVVMTTAAAGGGQGVGRGHLYHPIGRAIQVEGGVGERHPSADVRKQRIRDSDAIILVHATEDDLVKEQSSADNCQEEEVDAKIYQSLDLNDESDMLGKSAPALHSRVGVLKRGLLPSGLKSQGTSSRSRFSSEVDKASAGSKMQISESNAGHPVNLFPGESFSPYAVRHKILRTLLPRRIPIPEKRETDRAQSYSSSIHNESKPVQDSKNNKRSHMSSTVRKEKDEPSYSNERSTEDKTVIDVSRVHMQDEKHKFSGQDEFKQSDVIDTPLLSLKRQRRDSHNAARVMRQSNYARTNPSGESASAMNLGSDEERKKVILEHRAENMPHRRDHTMDEEGEHLYSEKAQSDQRSGSAGHRGEQVDKETFSDMVKLDEQNKKSKDRVKLNKVKKKMPGTHTRAADAQLRRKKKEDEIKSDYPLKEKRKGRGLLDRSDVKKRRKNGSKKDKVDSEKGVKEQHANRFLSTEDDLVFQRAEEGKYRKADNGNHQHVEKQKLGSKHYEKDATICERREEVSRRDKSEDYNHHKEREDTHQWRGFHNVKMERDDSRYVPAGSVGRISDDREVGAHSKDRAELRDSVQVFSADQECIRELDNYFEAQKWDSNHMEHCLESEAPAKYHLCEEDTFFQQHSKHQGKSSHGLSFDKRGQSYIEARSSDEQRHRSGRLCFDPCKGTNLRNKRKKTFSDLLDNSGQDPKNVDNYHANGNYRLNKHYQKALSSQSLNTIDVRWEQAEPVGGNGEVSLEICRSQGNAFEARCLTAKESPHVSHSGLSQDEHHQRGRSKLERWASQKGIDDDASRVMAHNKKLTKKGRQRGKHYKTSSRQSQEIVPGSSDRQISSQIDHSVPEAKKGTECDLRRHMLEGVGGNELCRNWKDKGAVKEEDVAVINPDDSSLNAHVQQPLKMQQLELAAKLEKRKARFKLPMTEEKESARRLTLNNHHPPDPTEVKPERPARKRRWGSS